MGSGSKLSLSLIAGLILVPLSAVAAVVVTSPPSEDPVLTAAMSPPSIPDVTAQGEIAAQVVLEPVSATAADLQAACGADGLYLVELEKEGSITDVQQAALDALRQLCSDEGMPLPDPPAPPAVVRTVVTPASGSTAAATSTDDRYEDEEDHEDEEDEHEEEDHEDEEDEHDEDDD